MNRSILIGRLTKDVELRFVPNSGKAVANFSVAVDRGMSKDKKEEAKQKGYPTADFINVVVWGKSAENCANYLAKGRMVAIEGSIQTSTYKTNDSETRYKTEVNASHVEFLEWGDKKNNSSDGGGQSGGGDFSYGQGNFNDAENDEDIPW